MLQAILFHDTSYEQHHGSQLVVREIYRLAAAAGIQIVRACPMRYDWRKDAQLKSMIATVDLCLINGEGTFHDNQRQAEILAELGPYCRQHDVPCFLINSLWQRNDGQLLEDMKTFTGIYLRDELSQQELHAHGVSAMVVPDLTLSHVTNPLHLQRHGIIINGSVFPERTYEAWQLAYDKKEEGARYLSIKALPRLQPDKGFPRYFWKSVVKRIKSGFKRQISRMTMLHDHIPTPENIDRLRWATSAASLTEFLQNLAGAAGVITGRFHCATLCLLTETPLYAIKSNTHKIEALLSAAGLDNRIFASYREAYAHKDNMAYSEAELAAIRRYLGNCRERSAAMFREIAGKAAS